VTEYRIRCTLGWSVFALLAASLLLNLAAYHLHPPQSWKVHLIANFAGALGACLAIAVTALVLVRTRTVCPTCGRSPRERQP
jgi:hypothetical protein